MRRAGREKRAELRLRREAHDAALTIDALLAVRDGQTDPLARRDRCPNWMIPPRIPVQRLTGLRRRGYLDYADAEWWLTELGERFLAAIGELR